MFCFFDGFSSLLYSPPRALHRSPVCVSTSSWCMSSPSTNDRSSPRWRRPPWVRPPLTPASKHSLWSVPVINNFITTITVPQLLNYIHNFYTLNLLPFKPYVNYIYIYQSEYLYITSVRNPKPCSDAAYLSLRFSIPALHICCLPCKGKIARTTIIASA